jgi:hypothetical protein
MSFLSPSDNQSTPSMKGARAAAEFRNTRLGKIVDDYSEL